LCQARNHMRSTRVAVGQRSSCAGGVSHQGSLYEASFHQRRGHLISLPLRKVALFMSGTQFIPPWNSLLLLLLLLLLLACRPAGLWQKKDLAARKALLDGGRRLAECVRANVHDVSPRIQRLTACCAWRLRNFSKSSGLNFLGGLTSALASNHPQSRPIA